MYRLPSRLLSFLALAVFAVSVLPAHAELSFIHSSNFYVVTSDNVSIHVHRKVAIPFRQVPVLLVHGTWLDGRTWDFPDRSVMDHLALRGYDAYALDLRGMGLSIPQSGPPDYTHIDMFNRVNDVVAVASYIRAYTGHAPVVIGWSGGGVVTGLFAVAHPELLAGVGFLSVARDGFTVPQNLTPILSSLLGLPSFQPPQPVVDEIVFFTDPVTGQSTMSLAAENTFFSITQPDSVKAVLQETEVCPFLPPVFVGTCAHPAWQNITAPALVADGSLDALAGEDRAKALFDALGSTNKQFVMFSHNSHGWFLEDNHQVTIQALDLFLSQFGPLYCSGDCESFLPSSEISELGEN